MSNRNQEDLVKFFSQYSDKLEDISISDRDKRLAERAVEDLRNSMMGVLSFQEYWSSEYNSGSFSKLKEEYNVIRHFSVEEFQRTTYQAYGGFLEMRNIIHRNNMNEIISNTIQEGTIFADPNMAEFPELALHTEDDRVFLRSIDPFFQSVDQDSVRNNMESGIRLLDEGSIALRNSSEVYQSFIDDQNYLIADGGKRPITNVIACIGSIISGGIAIGHDAFIAQEATSISTGGGLISAGIAVWPEQI